MSEKQFHILVADDEETIRKNLEAAFHVKGYRVSTAENGRAALKIFSGEEIDLAVVDLKMPGMDGFELLGRIKRLSRDTPVVVITGFADVETTAKALKAGASDFIVKPFGTKEIFHSVSRLLEIRRTTEANKQVFPFMSVNVTFDIPSTIENVNGVIHYLMAPVRSVGLVEPMKITNINIALYEALMNAIKHGNRGDASKRVRVSADITNDEATFTVRDEGPGFSRDDISGPSENPNLGTGRGIYLINNFMDEVRFNDAGNEVTMVKRRSLKDQAV